MMRRRTSGVVRNLCTTTTKTTTTTTATTATTAAEYAWRDARDRGYFADLDAYNRAPAGRIFEPTLMKASEALVWPTLPCVRLRNANATAADADADAGNDEGDGGDGGGAELAVGQPLLRADAVLVTLSFRESGRKTSATWRDAFYRTVDVEGVAQCTKAIDISVFEGFLQRRLMSGFLMKAIRSQARKEPRCSFFCCLQDIVEPLQRLRAQNRLAGYVFLLDSSGRVRFNATGKHTNDDDEILRRALDSVLDRKD